MSSKLPIDEDDVALIFEDIYRGRSVIPPHAVPSRPVLVRWDPTLPLSVGNCVVMEHGDAEKHTKECLGINAAPVVDAVTHGVRQKPVDFWGKEVAMVVDRRAKEIAKYQEWVM
jgi:tRNA threonylcarbamoyladenosine dehydratase